MLIYYSEKNSTDAIYGTKVTTALTRFNIDTEKLNTLHWSAAGNEVTYTFKVKKSGNYNLAFHYNNGKKEFDTFETIKIDGQVPFKEMYNYKFNPVSSGYANETLKDSNGNNYNSILKKELTQSQSSRKMNQLWKHTDMHYFYRNISQTSSWKSQRLQVAM